MGLLGRYTTYVGGVATDAHKLLAKLFPASPLATPLTQGDEKAAQKMVSDIATAKVVNGVGGLKPSDGQQQGDLGMFPTGVKLNYGDAPNVEEVKWTNAGDPANPYFPDISSPGPGKTDGKDKATDPQLKLTDVPATDTDPAGQNLRNPSEDSPGVYTNSGIGVLQKPGSSGGNT